MTAHTILLAEDEAMLRIVAVEMLKDEGFEVFEASDGVVALDILKEHPEIELLISDIKMPRLSGYELAEGALAIKPELKVVFMTGYSTEAPPAYIKELSIRTLQKPFNVVELSHLARNMLGV